MGTPGGQDRDQHSARAQGETERPQSNATSDPPGSPTGLPEGWAIRDRRTIPAANVRRPKQARTRHARATRCQGGTISRVAPRARGHRRQHRADPGRTRRRRKPSRKFSHKIVLRKSSGRTSLHELVPQNSSREFGGKNSCKLFRRKMAEKGCENPRHRARHCDGTRGSSGCPRARAGARRGSDPRPENLRQKFGQHFPLHKGEKTLGRRAGRGTRAPPRGRSQNGTSDPSSPRRGEALWKFCTLRPSVPSFSTGATGSLSALSGSPPRRARDLRR